MGPFELNRLYACHEVNFETFLTLRGECKLYDTVLLELWAGTLSNFTFADIKQRNAYFLTCNDLGVAPAEVRVRYRLVIIESDKK